MISQFPTTLLAFSHFFLITNLAKIFQQAIKFPADLVTFPEEVLNGKLHFSCSVNDIFAYSDNESNV